MRHYQTYNNKKPRIAKMTARCAQYMSVLLLQYVSTKSADDCARISTLQSYHYSAVKLFSKYLSPKNYTRDKKVSDQNPLATLRQRISILQACISTKHVITQINGVQMVLGLFRIEYNIECIL